MRRLGISVALALAAVIVLPAGLAQATFHLQKVNEAMLASASGDRNVRFVELYDAGGAEESFPSGFGPYGLAIYDAGAHPLASQALSGSGMQGAALTNRPYLVSTSAADTALGVAGDETLTVALPKTAGQACYTAFGGTAYSCITWGCITHFVSTSGTGSFHGAVPPDGKSAQRQSGDGIQIAAPTPKAANHSGTSPTACPPVFKFTGVGIPKQTVTVKQGKVPVQVKCPAKATGRCEGTLVLKTAKPVLAPDGKTKIVTLGQTNLSIAPGKSPKVQVPLSPAGKKVFSSHNTLKAVATAKTHVGSGKTKTTTGDVTLEHPKPKH